MMYYNYTFSPDLEILTIHTKSGLFFNKSTKKVFTKNALTIMKKRNKLKKDSFFEKVSFYSFSLYHHYFVPLSLRNKYTFND